MWSAVELREMRVFLTLAEELHFGRTAERLLITPSSVSQTIRTVEARIGGRLFDRTSRRVGLTPLGEHLRAGMAPAFEQVQAAYAATRDVAAGVSGVLRLSMYSPINGGPHFVEILTTFRDRHPGCRVEVVDTGLADQPAMLRRGEVDLVATRLPITGADLTIGPVLSSEERVVIVAADHPLAGRGTIGYEDVGDYLVTDHPSFPREMMDEFVPPRTPSGREIRRFVPQNFSEVLLRVATGEIVHPTVRSFFDHYRRPGVVAVAVRDLPRSRTALVSLAPRDGPAIAAFFRAASDVVTAREPRPTSSRPRSAGSRR